MNGPDNAYLDRGQMVLGWRNAGGTASEKVYDVACCDGRGIAGHTCDGGVGDTLDIANATYTNTMGDPMLNAVWTDPDFDPAQRALYNVRVLEIPKPTWQAHDAACYGIEMDHEVPMVLQDRAYISQNC